jgi:hypothetical protein
VEIVAIKVLFIAAMEAGVPRSNPEGLSGEYAMVTTSFLVEASSFSKVKLTARNVPKTEFFSA